MVRVKVTPEGRGEPASRRPRAARLGAWWRGPGRAADEAIALRTLDQTVARAQAMSRRPVAGRPGASVDDFLTERRRDAEADRAGLCWTPLPCSPSPG